MWRRPTAAAISSLLRNPAYAGMFVYGRTHFHPRQPGGPSRKHPLPPEQWQVMIPDKYPAYITRDTYTAIQAILRDNYQEYQQRRSRGVARAGAALLQGLAYCGHCGHKMTVQYHAAARYICNSHKMQLGGTECQRLPINPVDTCVVQKLWEALSAAELDNYDRAIAAFDEQRRQVERARQQQLERRATKLGSPRNNTDSWTRRTDWWRPSWSGAGSKHCRPSPGGGEAANGAGAAPRH